MAATAAATIRADEAELRRRLADASAPLNEPEAVVEFAPSPGDRGTEMRVRIEEQPRGGVIGRAAAVVAGTDTQQQLRVAVRRFKQLVETGEIVRSDSSPDGAVTAPLRKQDEAQPAEDPIVKGSD